MPNDIDATLRPLLYLPMVGSQRAVDMEMFVFGRPIDHVDEQGYASMFGGYRLHVQCSWRIIRSGRIVVGYTDMADPPGSMSAEDFDPNATSTNHRDELLGAYYAERRNRPRTVAGIVTTTWGDVGLTFDDGSILELFPDAAAHDTEYWRLLRPDGVDLVMSGAGLERIGSSDPATRRPASSMPE